MTEKSRAGALIAADSKAAEGLIEAEDSGSAHLRRSGGALASIIVAAALTHLTLTSGT